MIELNGEIVGYGAIDGTMLDEVSIKIPYQGRGLGRKFVRHLTNRVLEKGEGDPTLWCVVGNRKARNLYDSLGYQEIYCGEFSEKKFKGKPEENKEPSTEKPSETNI